MVDEYLFYECEIVEDDNAAPEGNLVQLTDEAISPEDDENLYFEIVDEDADEVEAKPKKKASKKADVKNEDVPATVEAVSAPQEEAPESKDEASKSKHKDKEKHSFFDKKSKAQNSDYTTNNDDTTTNTVVESPVVEEKSTEIEETAEEPAVAKQPSKRKSAKLVEQQPTVQKGDKTKIDVSIRDDVLYPHLKEAEKQSAVPKKQTAKKSAPKNSQKANTASQTDENDETILPPESAHIRTSIKKLSKTHNVQNVLNGSMFAIDTSVKIPQTTVSTAKKFDDPWAVAMLEPVAKPKQDDSTPKATPKPKTTKKNTATQKKSDK